MRGQNETKKVERLSFYLYSVTTLCRERGLIYVRHKCDIRWNKSKFRVRDENKLPNLSAHKLIYSNSQTTTTTSVCIQIKTRNVLPTLNWRLTAERKADRSGKIIQNLLCRESSRLYLLSTVCVSNGEKAISSKYAFCKFRNHWQGFRRGWWWNWIFYYCQVRVRPKTYVQLQLKG